MAVGLDFDSLSILTGRTMQEAMECIKSLNSITLIK
jgi:hypothetical protein